LLRGSHEETPEEMHYGFKTSAKGITKQGLESKALELCPAEFKDSARPIRVREGLRQLFVDISGRDHPGHVINLFPPESRKRKFVYGADSVSTSSSQPFTRRLKNTRKGGVCED